MGTTAERPRRYIYSSLRLLQVGYLATSEHLDGGAIVQNFAFDGASVEEDLSGQVASCLSKVEADVSAIEPSHKTYCSFASVHKSHE